ncbi:Glyco-tran-10-N domain-containing protein [Aphelenchoides fujianensis]|nr:Glyco-tran-10-N domain-containing protein [Aphelenchoides fujianensis]
MSEFAASLRSVFLLVVLALGFVTTIVYFNDEKTAKVDEMFQRYTQMIADQIQNETRQLGVRIGETEVVPSAAAEELPLVLFWTDKFYSRPQFNAATYAFSLNCEWKCRYTNDKARWNESRSIVIREQFPSGDYPPKVSDEQRTILILPEAPGRAGVRKGLAKIPKGYINMTLGFMHSMDIYKPYDKIIKQKATANQWAQIEKKLKAKKKGAFIVYSHCKSDSQREKYITELKKHFPVETYGKCGDAPCDTKCMKEKIRDYRFYIAFENNVCEDYITEKYFRVKDLILPLVLNESIYRARVPKDSYIAVDSFRNMTELADYLLLLMLDDAAYLRHFQWAREYSLKRPALYAQSYCDICRNAHDRSFRHVYEDIAEWFGPERRCDNTLVPRLLKSQV